VRGIPLAAIALGVFGSLGLTLSPASPGPEDAKSPVADKQINDLLEPLRKKHDLPALAAALVNRDGLIAVGAVGVRKRGTETPVTVNDAFHIGSDTKAMTATLVARLVEEGKLQWDTPLEKYFPDLADSMDPDLRKVTLVHLLTHHAGLPANFGIAERLGSLSKAEDVRKHRSAAVKKVLSEKLTNKPGEKFLYSNIGYVTAAVIAEQAADASWEDLMTERIFKPLGMKSAGFGAAGKPGQVDQPWPHRPDGKPVEPGPFADNPPLIGPAGRVHCSLPDWARFIADQLKGAAGERGLLEAATYKRLHTAPFRDKSYTPGGWGVIEGPLGTALGHDGSNTMNYATALLFPAKGVAVLVVTNQGGPGGPGEKGCHEARKVLMPLLSKQP
jgi:CubicO group peptidase (beta-lactamase class C family)